MFNFTQWSQWKYKWSNIWPEYSIFHLALWNNFYLNPGRRGNLELLLQWVPTIINMCTLGICCFPTFVLSLGSAIVRHKGFDENNLWATGSFPHCSHIKIIWYWVTLTMLEAAFFTVLTHKYVIKPRLFQVTKRHTARESCPPERPRAHTATSHRSPTIYPDSRSLPLPRDDGTDICAEAPWSGSKQF